MTTIQLENGKYTIQYDDGSSIQVLRYGNPWQDKTGDKLFLVMAQEIENLTRQRDMLIEAVSNAAERMGAINEEYLPLSGHNCLVFLNDLARSEPQGLAPKAPKG